jgi:hypothetical protein
MLVNMYTELIYVYHIFPSKILHCFVIHTKAGKAVPKHYNMKTYGGSYVQILVLLPSALIGGEGYISRPGRFTPLSIG